MADLSKMDECGKCLTSSFIVLAVIPQNFQILNAPSPRKFNFF